MSDHSRLTRTSAWILLTGSIALAAHGDETVTETSSNTDDAVHVAANGQDSPSCGSAASPCRSISFGIANATVAGTILVGPGRYGDLNFDGALGGPGEEAGEVGFGCQCMVKLDKQVRILSTHGASVTVLDSSALSSPSLPIFITANGAQLGRRYQGFLLKGWPNYTAVYVFNTTGVTIAGNIATGSATGFFTDGGSANVLERNSSLGNTTGFEVAGIRQTVRNNYVSGNVVGFVVYGAESRLVGNISSANEDTGFLIAGQQILLARNLATGHRLAGFRIEAGATARILQNNIYGNHFCGVLNKSGTTIRATGNYWGAPSGPGSDPADDVCNDEGDDVTLTDPFLPKPITVPREKP